MRSRMSTCMAQGEVHASQGCMRGVQTWVQTAVHAMERSHPPTCTTSPGSASHTQMGPLSQWLPSPPPSAPCVCTASRWGASQALGRCCLHAPPQARSRPRAWMAGPLGPHSNSASRAGSPTTCSSSEGGNNHAGRDTCQREEALPETEQRRRQQGTDDAAQPHRRAASASQALTPAATSSTSTVSPLPTTCPAPPSGASGPRWRSGCAAACWRPRGSGCPVPRRCRAPCRTAPCAGGAGRPGGAPARVWGAGRRPPARGRGPRWSGPGWGRPGGPGRWAG